MRRKASAARSRPATTPSCRDAITVRGDAIGGRDGVGRDVAGAAEVFDERLADDRLDEKRGQRRERHRSGSLCERCRGAIAAASARASSSVSRDRRGSAGRSGKSRRQCAPMLSSRRSAADDDHQRHRGRIGRRPGRTRERGQWPDRGAQGVAVAHDPGGARQDRTDGGRVGSGRGGRRLRSGAGERVGAPSIDRATIAPNTAASVSELLASRLAPCSPVEAASPQTQRPSTELRPSASAATPPI